MKLFGYWRSSASYRVRIAMNLKELDYDYCPVNLLIGEQLKDEYLECNPLGLVPALETDDGNILIQSIAIMEYLEEKFPTPSIIPADPIKRAHARAIAQTLASEAQPFGNLRIQKYLRNEAGLNDQAIARWLNRWPGGAMVAVEKILAKTAGEFCVGDHPSVADACLVPQIYASLRFNIDISDCGRSMEIYRRCLAHPAIERANPDNQPDAVKG